ncbi:MAG: hypothetical protein RBG13Loki_2553 [Promethearchaeota archaeon CR_4]|nr:MAG: hypothetical protein RBG13Loki_2553 [Candidatus Lokiarchaeota archaeon CR_4]
MIHVFAVIERLSGNGDLLYKDPDFPQFEPSLFWGFLSALNSFSKELIGTEEELRETDLEHMKIVIYSPREEYVEFDRSTDPALVVLADKFDNEDFLLKKLRKIRELLGPYLLYMMTPLGKVTQVPIPPQVMEKVTNVIKYTQHFPEEVLKNLFLQRLLRHASEFVKFTHVYIADVDEGLLFAAESKRDSYSEPVADLFQLTPSKKPRNRLDPAFAQSLETREVFQTLMAEIPFNRDLFLETIIKSKQDHLSREGFVIKQISPNSDFYLMVRLLYDPTRREEVDLLLKSEIERVFEALNKGNVPITKPL